VSVHVHANGNGNGNGNGNRGSVSQLRAPCRRFSLSHAASLTGADPVARRHT
jgi:hypothetical protein